MSRRSSRKESIPRVYVTREGCTRSHIVSYIYASKNSYIRDHVSVACGAVSFTFDEPIYHPPEISLEASKPICKNCLNSYWQWNRLTLATYEALQNMLSFYDMPPLKEKAVPIWRQ